MPLHGVILAAGRGTRLGPLTETLPKPLLPVANRPVMEQGILSLRRLGITQISVNTSYLAEQILDTFGDGSAYGTTLNWLVEREPAGTAGGLKAMQHTLGGNRIIVIAGDAMLDVDLLPLLRAHEERGAFASLATIPVAHPSQYGVVVTADDGRIVQFQEKPAPGTEISRQANTGIYIFEPELLDLIPAGTFCDFALHVFPAILRDNLPFYALPVQGYWTDIGNPGDYLQANLDYLQGRIAIAGSGNRQGNSLIGDGVQIDDVRCSRCIIGEQAVIPAGSLLTDCVVWAGTRLLEPCTLASAVITPSGSYAIVGKEAHPLAEIPVSTLTSY